MERHPTVPAAGRVGRPPTRRQVLISTLPLTGLALLAGCGASPTREPPRSRVPRIGYLASGAAGDPNMVAFLEGLRELGYVDAHTIAIDGRFADGREERIGLWQLQPLLVHTILFGGSYGSAVERTAARYA